MASYMPITCLVYCQLYHIEHRKSKWKRKLIFFYGEYAIYTQFLIYFTKSFQYLIRDGDKYVRRLFKSKFKIFN
jgi:hypothetical protein